MKWSKTPPPLFRRSASSRSSKWANLGRRPRSVKLGVRKSEASPHFHRPLWHRDGRALCRGGLLHERSDHRGRPILRLQLAALVEELLTPATVVRQDVL